MPTIAIVYHSGYGHTAVIAESLAEGVRTAGATPQLLRIESAAQDFAEFVAAVGAADAVVFGSPTYMGDVSAAFKAFAEATSGVWQTQGWRDKLAAGFTNSLSFSGDKLHALQSLSILAAQHGMVWIGLGEPPPVVPAAERGADTINRVGGSLGLLAQSDNAAPGESPGPGERETARRFGARIARAAARWSQGRAAA